MLVNIGLMLLLLSEQGITEHYTVESLTNCVIKTECRQKIDNTPQEI